MGEAQFLALQKIRGNIADQRKSGKDLIHPLAETLLFCRYYTAGCFVHCPQGTLESYLAEFLGYKDLGPGVQNDGRYLLGEVVSPILLVRYAADFLETCFRILLNPPRWLGASFCPSKSMG